MGPTKARVIRRLGFASFMLVVPLSAGYLALGPDESCIAVNRWAEAQTTLPRSLGELRAYPAAHRRALAAKLPAEVQSTVWSEHFTTVLADPLTPAQARLVSQARELLATADHVATLHANPESADRLMADVQAHFSDDDIRRVFYDLGPRDPISPSVFSLRVAARRTIRSWLAPVAAASAVSCECRGAHLGCSSGLLCYAGNCEQNPCYMGLNCVGLCDAP